jgi:recombination protein RecA
VKTPPILISLGAQESKPKKQEPETPSNPLTPLSKAEKVKAGNSVVKAMNKEYPNLLLPMGKRVGQRIASYPTNLISFDEGLTGCGGVPKGRIVEIFGPEASGKTTACLHFIAEIQKAGGMAAFVDAEHALDPTYASRIGVDIDELLISQPDSGEQALEVVEALVRARASDIIVVDSVSALVPQAELDGDMGDSHMGLQARLMSQAMRKLRGICNINGVTVIFINQIREKIGVSFGDPEVTSGGRALKFYASLRIKIRQLSKGDGGIVEEDGVRIGQRSILTAVKNKVGGAPYATTILELIYQHGWDKDIDLANYAIKIGVVEDAGKGWYLWKGERYRKNDLTSGDNSDMLLKEVKQTLEDRRKSDAEKVQEAAKDQTSS